MDHLRERPDRDLPPARAGAGRHTRIKDRRIGCPAERARKAVPDHHSGEGRLLPAHQ